MVITPKLDVKDHTWTWQIKSSRHVSWILDHFIQHGSLTQLDSAWLSLTLDPLHLAKASAHMVSSTLARPSGRPLYFSLSTLCFPKTILHSNAILCPILTTAWLLELRLTFALKNCTLRQCAKPSSDPESHPKVGFESVSGFGFRVSGFVDWNQLSLSVSGFGFRCLKPTFAVGFGVRVSGFAVRNQL